MNTLLRANLLLLFLVAVFDPADQVTHMKVPLFVGVWIIFLIGLFFSREKTPPVADSLWLYVAVFAIVLPLTSILLYFVRGGMSDSYDGFQYFKSYLFLTLAIVLAVKRVDAIRPLSFVLTLLSVAIIIMGFFSFNDQALTDILWQVGYASGAFTIGERSYADLTYSYVYFHTAPLLVLSIAYFAYQFITSKSRARYLNFALLMLNLVAMVWSGTRNDIIFGLLTPLGIFLWYSGKKYKLTALVVLLVVATMLTLYGSDVVQAMFDPDNESNAIKLAHMKDYFVMFNDPKMLLFGQGLGSYFYATGFGNETSITELTYFEFIRNFGLFIAMIYYGLLLYPVTKLANSAFKRDCYLLIAYASYLVMCFSNPLLVASTGMLALAIVLATVIPSQEDNLGGLEARRFPEVTIA